MIDKQEFIRYATHTRGLDSQRVGSYISQVENMTRGVVEERLRPVREFDVFSRLIMDRIIVLGKSIDEEVANVVIAQLLFLASVDREKDIQLYINSPGGQVYPGLGIYDTMQYIAPNVATICIGLAASMAAVLLAGGAPQKRAALPHARIMIHQPLGGMQGQLADMEITVKQVLGLKKDLYEILAHHTGKPFKVVEDNADRDYWMRAEEAKNYGIVDHVLSKRAK